MEDRSLCGAQAVRYAKWCLLHDALPVDQCPFDWSMEGRLMRADERIADGVLYEGYGIAPDPERIDYYRLLWDMA